MLVKIVTLFLIGMAVLAMFGRLRLPGQDRLAKLRGRAKVARSRGRCPGCGAPRPGGGACPCGRT